MRPLPTFASFVCLGACATATPAPAVTSAGAPVLASTDPPRPAPPPLAATPAPTPTTAPRQDDAECRPLQYAPSVCTGGKPLVVDDSTGHSATLADLADFDAWFRARGAEPPRRDHESWCQVARFGVEEAVICSPIRHVERGRAASASWYYRVVERRQIYVVRGRRARAVFDRPVRLMPLDSLDEDSGPLFSIELHLEDGVITLREHREGSCAEARADVTKDEREAKRDGDATQLGWSRLDRSLIEELCGALGRYPWRSNGDLRREATAPTRGGHSSW